MRVDRFNKLVEETLNQIKEVLIAKGKEYSTDSNKLHNFDQGARMTGESREKVLFGMALKHHISIADMREQVSKGELPSLELVNEKFGDAINYLILEKASIIDRIEKRLASESDHVTDSLKYLGAIDGEFIFRWWGPGGELNVSTEQPKPGKYVHKIEGWPMYVEDPIVKDCSGDCILPPFICNCKSK